MTHPFQRSAARRHRRLLAALCLLADDPANPGRADEIITLEG